MPNLFEHFFAMLNNPSEAQPILGNAKVCKPSEEKTNLYLFEEQATFKAENSRAISAGFVRNLHRICSGFAPSLRAISAEITRKSGKDCT